MDNDEMAFESVFQVKGLDMEDNLVLHTSGSRDASPLSDATSGISGAGTNVNFTVTDTSADLYSYMSTSSGETGRFTGDFDDAGMILGDDAGIGVPGPFTDGPIGHGQYLHSMQHTPNIDGQSDAGSIFSDLPSMFENVSFSVTDYGAGAAVDGHPPMRFIGQLDPLQAMQFDTAPSFQHLVETLNDFGAVNLAYENRNPDDSQNNNLHQQFSSALNEQSVVADDSVPLGQKFNRKNKLLYPHQNQLLGGGQLHANSHPYRPSVSNISSANRSRASSTTRGDTSSFLDPLDIRSSSSSPFSTPVPTRKAKIADLLCELKEAIGDEKPMHSYAQLIAHAIQSAPNHMMTLSGIYNWIVENYPYFNNAPKEWRNSVRHNLSLNCAFVRVPRPSKEPGKGAYWTIDMTGTAKPKRQPKKSKSKRSDGQSSDASNTAATTDSSVTNGVSHLNIQLSPTSSLADGTSVDDSSAGVAHSTSDFGASANAKKRKGAVVPSAGKIKAINGLGKGFATLNNVNRITTADGSTAAYILPSTARIKAETAFSYRLIPQANLSSMINKINSATSVNTSNVAVDGGSRSEELDESLEEVKNGDSFLGVRSSKGSNAGSSLNESDKQRNYVLRRSGTTNATPSGGLHRGALLNRGMNSSTSMQSVEMHGGEQNASESGNTLMPMSSFLPRAFSDQSYLLNVSSETDVAMGQVNAGKTFFAHT